jgi:4-oxalocrotonate tautomerase
VPMLTVSIAADAPPSADLAADVARSLTRLTAEVLHKDPAVTDVAVRFVDPQHWFVGGAAATGQPSYFVEVRVTEGTNTKNQKAEYIARVHQALDRLLGGVRPESYVQVAEVHADAYGYGGLTGERRYIEAAA